MKDHIDIDADNNSGNVSGTNNGVIINEPQKSVLFNLKEQITRYEDNSEKQLRAYYSWLKLIMSFSAGIVVVVAAWGSGMFYPKLSCVVVLIASMISIALNLAFGLLGLVGETQFFKTRCRSVVSDVENQLNNPETPLSPSMNKTRVRSEYEKYSRWSFLCFAATLLCLIFYVCNYSLSEFCKWNTTVDAFVTVIEAIALIVFVYKMNKKMQNWVVDWDEEKEDDTPSPEGLTAEENNQCPQDADGVNLGDRKE